MTSKIFRAILSAAVTVLAVALVVTTMLLYKYFTGVQKNQLKDELYLVSVAVEQSGKDYLSKLEYENYRITWVAEDGKVIFDSKVNSHEMENHLEREEISEAFKHGTGSSQRHSDTLMENTIYEAVRISDGTVLRMSLSIMSGVIVFISMLQPIIVIVIIAIIISAVLANKMSKKITKPLNSLDLNYPLDNNTYEELLPLLKRIDQQKRKINHKVRELKQKKDEFALITENMREGLILLDSNKQILSINRSAMELIGATDECVGEDFLKVERRHDINTVVERAYGNGHCEIRIQKNNCEYQYDISRIQNENKTVGAVLLAFDVTEQANSERMRREFSANVSHELKTPLQTITGSAELIENGLVKSEDMPRFVGHIRKEAQRLVTLVDDIIRLSQLDEGGQMPKENISLKSITNEVFDILSDSALKKNISLKYVGEDVVISGVKRLLFEVIYNLCDNAIKYNKEDGEVIVNIFESEKDIICKISDTGIGIPIEHQTRIFERFYRVDKSHSKKSGGTGLGLSIVKHAVLYHNGEISLESKVDKGTSIIIKFSKK